MWKINSPKQHNDICSLDYQKGQIVAPNHPFYIHDKDDHVIAAGVSSERMSPVPLWSYGFKHGGQTIWYLNHSTFLYELYEPHREKAL